VRPASAAARPAGATSASSQAMKSASPPAASTARAKSVTGRTSGTRLRPHCFIAARAFSCQRSSRLRASATVWAVIIG